MITTITAMLIFALVGAISPGPVNVIATSAGASYGLKRTIPHILGATVAYTLIIFFSGVGLNRGLILIPEIETTLLYVGGTFLLYMAFKIAIAKPKPFQQMTVDTEVKKENPPTFIAGILSQGLNPKAWLVAMSGISIFVTSHSQVMLYLSLFCIISFTMCFIGISTWAAIGHSVRRFLSTPARQVAFNIVMGLMLSGTVFSMLFLH